MPRKFNVGTPVQVSCPLPEDEAYRDAIGEVVEVFVRPNERYAWYKVGNFFGGFPPEYFYARELDHAPIKKRRKK